MSFDVSCPCGKRFRVPERFAGKTGRCRACGTPFSVPRFSVPDTVIEVEEDDRPRRTSRPGGSRPLGRLIDQWGLASVVVVGTILVGNVLVEVPLWLGLGGDIPALGPLVAIGSVSAVLAGPTWIALSGRGRPRQWAMAGVLMVVATLLAGYPLMRIAIGFIAEVVHQVRGSSLTWWEHRDLEARMRVVCGLVASQAVLGGVGCLVASAVSFGWVTACPSPGDRGRA